MSARERLALPLCLQRVTRARKRSNDPIALPITAPTMTLVDVRLSIGDGETEVASLLTIVTVVGVPEIVVAIVPVVRAIETRPLPVWLCPSVPLVVEELGAPIYDEGVP